MKTLADLYKSHTGKVSDKWALYLREYDRLFAPYREQAISMLEIGIQNGGSLEIWSQYFPNAQKFIGCDINPDCEKLRYEDPRIAIIVGDATTAVTQVRVLEQSSTFDLIIEDGSHTSNDIVKAFVRYFPALRPGGLFVAEDLHCSYWQEFEGGIFHPYSSITFFKHLVDMVNHEHWGIEKSRSALIAGFKQTLKIDFDESLLEQISSVEFLNSICVVRKKNLTANSLGVRIIAGMTESVVGGHLTIAGTELKAPVQDSNAWSNLNRPPAETYQDLVNEINTNKDCLRQERITAGHLRSEVQAREVDARRLRSELQSQQAEAFHLHNRIFALQKSMSWRYTSPLRKVGSFVQLAVRIFCRIRDAAQQNFGYSQLVRKAWCVYKHEGILGVKRRIIYLYSNFLQDKVAPAYFNRSGAMGSIEVTSDACLAKMCREIEHFSNRPLISILMPTYNPHPEWLDRAIESVRRQIYSNWQLCIADDASTNPEIRPILERHAREDLRIKVVFRSINGNISAASNSALEIATGDYLALLDHDDELTADALYWNVQEIFMHPAADVIYSDEDKISPDGEQTDVFFKPDWSPELMFNCMYMGHLTVYKKSLIDQVGGFRTEYDYSQDYDMALRATEVAAEIRHIPRILYHWRQSEGSAAQGGKPYARISNLAALQAAIDRRGLNAKAVELSTANRVKIIGGQPKVSIVIPTDSERNLITCLDELAAMTDYQSLEVVVVTNSRVVDQFIGKYGQLQLRFCCYDKPYNFSDKCNMGGREANGDVVVFFNDDVRPLHASWLEDLIELLAVPGVGAVSPKLIYEDHRIQHAGLVSGVRGLVGTAFHCLPESTTEYFCFAQSVRNVSALSGACFAMQRKVFLDVGGFDAVNTPIMHSDVDLSFKIREAGFRCVYTPHAKLLHIGHQSLSEFDKNKKKDSQDKADIFLLKRWGGYLSYDPYFTDAMRGFLYHDSPEVYGMFGVNRSDFNECRPDVLVVTHDLSGSGAPMIAYLATKHLLAAGAFPVVVSPEDGPMRGLFELLGVPIIIDSLLLTQHNSVRKLAGNFDCVLANTVITWPIVYQLLDHPTPVLWYLHESHLISDMAASNQLVTQTLQNARHLYVGSERSASFCRQFNQNVNILTYGVPDMYSGLNANNDCDGPVVFSVFGSIESRKGQDVFLDAIRLIGDRLGEKAVFNLVGRTMDSDWIKDRRSAIDSMKSVIFHGPVEHERYRELLCMTDVVVCPSRDDTLPLVTLDALSMGKTLICTVTTGTSGFLVDGEDGVVIPSEDPRALANAMVDIVENPSRYASIGAAARQVYLENFSEDRFSERIVSLVRAVARVG